MKLSPGFKIFFVDKDEDIGKSDSIKQSLQSLLSNSRSSIPLYMKPLGASKDIFVLSLCLAIIPIFFPSISKLSKLSAKLHLALLPGLVIRREEIWKVFTKLVLFVITVLKRIYFS